MCAHTHTHTHISIIIIPASIWSQRKICFRNNLKSQVINFCTQVFWGGGRVEGRAERGRKGSENRLIRGEEE